jgi:ABC-2 type transport system permease protein
MRNIWTIARREFKLYFSSPVAYAVSCVILGTLGIFFYLNLKAAAADTSYVPGVGATLGPLAVMLVLLTPAITTRLLAEERRLGTIELLLTAPIRDWELVIGKWLGAFLMVLVIIILSLVFPLVLTQLVEPGIDYGPVISGYLGIILMAASLIAVGVLVSSFFNNQIAAFAVTLGVMIFLWWIIGPIAQFASGASAGSQIISYLDFQGHYFNTLMQGVIEIKDIVYYLSLTILALFFGSVSVEIRRWG